MSTTDLSQQSEALDVAELDFDGNTPAMGVFFVLATIMIIAFFNRIEGKLFRMKDFLNDRDWHIVESESTKVTINKLLLFLCWFFIFAPLISILAWGFSILFGKLNTTDQAVPGIAVLLIGLAFVFFLYGAFKVKWNRFRMTPLSLIAISLAGILFGSFQVIAIFVDSNETFFGISAIFLTINAIVNIFLTFINSGTDGTSIKEIIDKYFPNGSTKNPQRSEHFSRELEADHNNPDYIPTKDEVDELFTIPRAGQKKKGRASVLGGGVQKIFMSMAPGTRLIVSMFLYVISLGILVAYSIIIWNVFNSSRLGIVTSIAVFITDIINFLYLHAQIANSPVEISLNIVIFRFCLFVFGGNYWVYGYHVLYMYLGLILGYNISQKRFPNAESFLERNLDNLGSKREKIDSAKAPEFIMAFATITYIILLAVLQVAQLQHVPLPSYTLLGVEMAYYTVGFFTLIINLILIGLMITYRQYQRKRKGIKSGVYRYVLWKKIDSYWSFMLGTYALIVIGCIGAWYTSSNILWVIMGVFVPIMLILILNAYVHYVLNDYRILQDITKLNRMSAKHNKKVEKMRAKINQIHKNVLEQSKGADVDVNQGAFKKIQEERKAQKEKNKQASSALNERDLMKDDVIEEGGDDEGEQHHNENDLNVVDPHSESVTVGVNREGTQENPTESKMTQEVTIEENNDDVTEEQRAQMKHRLLIDHVKEKGFCSAFCGGKLRKNDYHIILSFLIFFIINAVMATIICAESDSLFGITISVPFYHYIFVIGSQLRVLAQNANFQCWEISLYVFGFVAQYGWGIVDFIFRFDSDVDKDGAGNFISVYVIVIPFISFTGSFIYKWMDDKGKLTTFTIVNMVLSILHGIGIAVTLFMYVGAANGIIVSIVVALIIFAAFQAYIFVKNDFYLPKGWQIADIILGLLVSLVSFVLALIYDTFSVFMGFSITFLIIVGVPMAYAILSFIRDNRNFDKKPLFYSPWVFPVYIYDPEKDNIETHNRTPLIMLMGLILCMGWSIACSIWVKPFYVGIAASCLFEIIMVIVVLYMVSLSPLQLRLAIPYIDDILLKKAWLESKTAYLNGRSAISMIDLISYEEIIQKRDALRVHLKKLRSSGAQMIDHQIGEKAAEWNMDMIDESSEYACSGYLFELEQRATKIYIEELELIIQLQLLIVLHAETAQAQERKLLFKFLQSKNAELHAIGIYINLPGKGNNTIRYIRVFNQIEKLSAEKQHMFNQMRENFIDEEREKEAIIQERARKEEEENKKRQERLQNMDEERRKLLESIDETQPVEQWPDCYKKYCRIVDEWNASGKSKKFQDSQFQGEKASGAQLNRIVADWKRASEADGTFLYQDTINAQDVIQGQLGDCYFLSAMSVMGDRYVKPIIKFRNPNDPEEWKCGAFCVTFFKNDQEIEVIIDDTFPVYGNGDWCFCKGGKEGKELWPMVLEKAYAKLNGCYEYIAAGKVQYALSDMTGGVPEYIDLKKVSGNIDAFWSKISKLHKAGSLMGAGSPEGEDTDVSEMGIVQGHAYGIIDLQHVDGHRLVRLRNPHGEEGAEWNGDWADDSENWTDRVKNKVNYVDELDGTFWMDVDDFTEHFKYIYICRILSHFNNVTLAGAWSGISAAGLPSRANMNCKIGNNPQYKITVSRPCQGFLKLTQNELVSMFKGKQNIMFMVFRNGGKRVHKVDRGKMQAMSGAPTNLKTVSSEIQFDKKVSYPYSFTVVIANTNFGPAGEGTFNLGCYVDDPKMKFVELPQE